MLSDLEGKCICICQTFYCRNVKTAFCKSIGRFWRNVYCITRGKKLRKNTFFLEKQCFLIIVGHWTVKYQTLSKRFGHECPNSILRAHRKISRRKVSFGSDFHFINFGHQTEVFLSLCWKTFRLASQNSNLHVHLNISRKLFPSKRKILLIYHSGNFFRQGCQKCSLRVHTNILREVFVLKDYVFPFNRI